MCDARYNEAMAARDDTPAPFATAEEWREHKRLCASTGARFASVAHYIETTYAPGAYRQKLISQIAPRAVRIRECADELLYHECPKCGRRHIFRANLCRDRFCPVCSWRRSILNAKRIHDVLDNVMRDEKPRRLIFCTLTVENCDWSRLGSTLRHILASWTKFSRRKAIKDVTHGYIRSLEITRGKDGRAHPHIHALFLVDEHYFSRENPGYLHQSTICHLWKSALSASYLPIVDIRAVKPGEDLHDVVSEISKYIVKTSAISGLSDADFLSFIRAVAGVRMLGSAGRLRLPVVDHEETEAELLENSEDAAAICPVCKVDLLVFSLIWQFGNYTKAEPGAWQNTA